MHVLCARGGVQLLEAAQCSGVSASDTAGGGTFAASDCYIMLISMRKTNTESGTINGCRSAGAGTISLTATEKNIKITDIQAREKPHGIAIFPDGEYVFVSNEEDRKLKGENS